MITSVDFKVRSPGVTLQPFRSCQPHSHRDLSRETSDVEKVVPWVGPLLLSWAGLLGQEELMASGKH